MGKSQNKADKEPPVQKWYIFWSVLKSLLVAETMLESKSLDIKVGARAFLLSVEFLNQGLGSNSHRIS